MKSIEIKWNSAKYCNYCILIDESEKRRFWFGLRKTEEELLTSYNIEWVEVAVWRDERETAQFLFDELPPDILDKKVVETDSKLTQHVTIVQNSKARIRNHLENFFKFNNTQILHSFLKSPFHDGGRSLSYRKWFPYDNGLRHERVKHQKNNPGQTHSD